MKCIVKKAQNFDTSAPGLYFGYVAMIFLLNEIGQNILLYANFKIIF